MAGRSAHHEEIVSAESELLTTACRSDRRRLESLLRRDFRSTDLADGVVLLTYRIRGEHGSTRSSIWVREDGRWLLRFHQGTRTPS